MSVQRPEQPRLSELMSRYLTRQTEARLVGLARVDTAAEVMLHDAALLQSVDPRLAWEHGLAVLSFFDGEARHEMPAPPGWAELVAAQEPAVSLALCASNYPQILSDLQPLRHTADWRMLRPAAARSIPSPGLLEWAKKCMRHGDFPRALMAAGALRLAGHHDEAAAWLQANETSVPSPWQAAWANEIAALAWHRGQTEEAYNRWQQQEASIPVLFNRGMAALFLGQPAGAVPSLGAAVARIPENSGWHHLGRLYLAMAGASAP
jgi:tetratricopeptide (TPR) repeat protein